jgi:auxin efflux carrier family protein
MALQEKAIACGVGLTVLTMVLRFVAAPAVALIGAFIVGLRGDVLRFAVIQVNIHH